MPFKQYPIQKDYLKVILKKIDLYLNYKCLINSDQHCYFSIHIQQSFITHYILVLSIQIQGFQMQNYQKFQNSLADDSTTGSQLQQYHSQRQSQSSHKDGQFYYQNKIQQISRKMAQTDSSVLSSNNQIKNSLLSEDKQHTIVESTETHEDSQRSQSSKISLSAAMFAMMAGALGTGIFNLPFRITQIGIIMFAVYVVVACAFSYIGCLLLQRMIIAKGFNSYGQICTKSYGKAMLRLSQVCLILFPWGIAVCFQVIMAKFILQLLADVFDADLYSDRNHDIYNSNGETIRVIVNVIIICADFALIQLKDMRIIQRLAVIGVCSVIYNAITIFVLMFVGFTHKGDHNVDYDGILQLDWALVKWALFERGWFSMHTQAVASILFCYINHQLVFPTCKNMENPTNSRLRSCFLRSNVNELIVYIIIGLSGYLLLAQHQDQLPIGPMVLTSISVWPMTLGKALMIITLFLAVPLSMFPARTILKEALNVQDNNEMHYILSIGLALSSSIIAIAFVKVNSYFGLLGGTAGVLMGGGIPALCYWKTIMKENQQQRNAKNYLILALCGIVCVIGFIGAILSVFDPV